MGSLFRVGAWLTAGSLALGLGCKEPPPKKAADKAADKAAAQPTASPKVAVAPVKAAAAKPEARPGPAVSLTRVPGRTLDSPPTLFDPSGRFMAVVDAKLDCQLWNLEAMAYVGTVPLKSCEDWLLSPCQQFDMNATIGQGTSEDKSACNYIPVGERSRRSLDGAATAHWSGSTLAIKSERGGEAREVKIKAGCSKDSCADVAAVAFSPDGKQLALARQLDTKIYVVDSESGKQVKVLKLAASEVVLPWMLGWGTSGLVAVLGARQEEVSEETIAAANRPAEAAAADGASDGEEVPEQPAQKTEQKTVIYGDMIDRGYVALWRTLSSAKQERGLSQHYGEGVDGVLVMDPLGRFVFMMTSLRSSGTIGQLFDVAENRPTRLKWQHSGDDMCAPAEVGEGRWIPGTWPVWQTGETERVNCDPAYVAWQLRTGPGVRGLAKVKLKSELDTTAVRVVKEDGKTVATLRGKAASDAAADQSTANIDAKGRWQGLAKNVLRRLTDKEELTLHEDGCAQLATGVFDCPLGVFTPEIFLMGADPLTSAVVHGEQVAHLYHHPGLVDDFFEGKPVAPKLPGGAPGQAPRLDKSAVRYLDGQTPNLEVTLLAHDGGSGVASVRAWASGAPLSFEKPVTLVAEQPTPVGLNIPPSTCGQISISVCNSADYLCSRAVSVPFCTKKHHKVKG